MYFPDAWIDELRSKCDIVDIIGSYIPLKQKGNRLWACCPFHNEKTPSFSVDPAQQMFYCFGCHKGGNVFTFIMDMDRMEFSDVLTDLAERVHMQLPKGSQTSKQTSYSREDKENIFRINREAAIFFHNALWKPDGAEALSYLHKRGLSDQTIKRFGLGSTEIGRDACFRSLIEKGFAQEEILKSGIAVQREYGISDMFQNRVMFPIIDGYGNVLGFGGRVMSGNGPKYLNTGDTPVFNKRRNLYAMNFIRKERNLKKVILSEGYMDVIALRSAGIEGVVATLGTALTEEQARLMKRLAPEIWISYDGDGAGQKAALRALDIFEQLDIPAKVIDYPDNMDPDEYIRANGPEGFEKLKPLTCAEYRMIRAKDGVDLSDEQSRIGYAITCCGILRKVKNPVEREGYLKKLEIDTGFSRGVLLEQIGVVQTEQPEVRISSGPRNKPVLSNIQRYEQILLSLLAQRHLPVGTLHAEDFSEGLYRDIAVLLLNGEHPSSVIDRLDLPEEKVSEAVSAMNADMLPEDNETALRYAQETLRSIRKEKLDALYESLLAEMNQASSERRTQIRDKLIEIETERAQIGKDDMNV